MGRRERAYNAGVRIAILGSGSKGNVTLVAAEGTTILVDAGLGPRVLEERMIATLGAVPERIDGVVVTHAHRDHAQHAPAYAERFGCPVYVNEPTLRGVRWDARPKTFVVARSAAFRVGAIEVRPLPVPHDAPQVALVLEGGGARTGLVTDLGHVPAGLADHLRGCDTLLLESNHDPVLLRDGPYPEPIKRRVLGDRGHLSNAQAAALLAELACGLARVVLMHLSETNNRPSLAHAAASQALRRSRARLELAWQERPIVVETAPTQLALDL